MTNQEQLEKWVAGESIHNHDLDQCCPDFSCCCKDILAPVHERINFKKAFMAKDEKTIFLMLGTFLQRMAIHESKSDVYLAGQEAQGQTLH